MSNYTIGIILRPACKDNDKFLDIAKVAINNCLIQDGGVGLPLDSKRWSLKLINPEHPTPLGKSSLYRLSLWPDVTNGI